MRNFFSVLATPSLKVSENTYWTLIFSTIRKSQQPKGPQLMRGSRDFRWELGEAIRNPGSSVTIKALTLFFLSSTYLTEVQCGFFSKKAVISQDLRWGPTFSMGSNFLQGAEVSNCFFPTEACYFTGGSRPPATYLWISPCSFSGKLFIFSWNRKSKKPEDHARTKEFSSGGGGGGQGPSVNKKALTTFFVFFYFTEVQLVLSRSYNFPRFGGFRRGQTFSMGVQLFTGGGIVQLLIPHRNPYNL